MHLDRDVIAFGKYIACQNEGESECPSNNGLGNDEAPSRGMGLLKINVQTMRPKITSARKYSLLITTLLLGLGHCKVYLELHERNKQNTSRDQMRVTKLRWYPVFFFFFCCVLPITCTAARYRHGSGVVGFDRADHDEEQSARGTHPAVAIRRYKGTHTHTETALVRQFDRRASPILLCYYCIVLRRY